MVHHDTSVALFAVLRRKTCSDGCSSLCVCERERGSSLVEGDEGGIGPSAELLSL